MVIFSYYDHHHLNSNYLRNHHVLFFSFFESCCYQFATPIPMLIFDNIEKQEFTNIKNIEITWYLIKKQALISFSHRYLLFLVFFLLDFMFATSLLFEQSLWCNKVYYTPFCKVDFNRHYTEIVQSITLLQTLLWVDLKYTLTPNLSHDSFHCYSYPK